MSICLLFWHTLCCPLCTACDAPCKTCYYDSNGDKVCTECENGYAISNDLQSCQRKSPVLRYYFSVQLLLLCMFYTVLRKYKVLHRTTYFFRPRIKKIALTVVVTLPPRWKYDKYSPHKLSFPLWVEPESTLKRCSFRVVLIKKVIHTYCAGTLSLRS